MGRIVTRADFLQSLAVTGSCAQIDRQSVTIGSSRAHPYTEMTALAAANMGAGQCDRKPTALTDRQQIALALEKAGYKPFQIAKIMDISRENASRLLARAHAAHDYLRKSAIQYLAE